MYPSPLSSELIFATELVISSLALAIPTSSSGSSSRGPNVELDEIEVRLTRRSYVRSLRLHLKDSKRNSPIDERVVVPPYFCTFGAFQPKGGLYYLELIGKEPTIYSP